MTKTIDRFNEVKNLAKKHGFDFEQDKGRYELWHAGVIIFSGLALISVERFINDNKEAK